MIFKVHEVSGIQFTHGPLMGNRETGPSHGLVNIKASPAISTKIKEIS